MVGTILATLLMAMSTVAHSTIVQQRHFDVGSSFCTYKIIASRMRVTDEPFESLIVQCDGKQILSRSFPETSIGDISVSIHQPTRISMSFERGTGSGIEIIQVLNGSHGPEAKVLLEHFSKCGGESLEDADLVFEHVGRRFVGAEILPEATNVFRWKDGTYQFAGGFRWNKDATWGDRFCLEEHSENCPSAQPTIEPIPDTH